MSVPGVAGQRSADQGVENSYWDVELVEGAIKPPVREDISRVDDC